MNAASSLKFLELPSLGLRALARLGNLELTSRFLHRWLVWTGIWRLNIEADSDRVYLHSKYALARLIQVVLRRAAASTCLQ